jgi:CHAT domain-containing protein
LHLLLRAAREGKQATIRLHPGPLGAVFDPRSARAAVRAWRRQTTSVVQRGSGHAPLPGTALEVNALARLVGARATTLLTGSLASEQQLDRMAQAGYLKQFRLVHLATHGQVDWQRPEHSALVLAQDRLPDPVEQARRGLKVYDGHLRVGTILRDWQLDADLVVLSACQSGLGKYTTGEGLLGFTQAFLQKGARSVVLSRWKVDDTATALLMIRFYENLLGKRAGLKQGMKRAEALAEAKKWLRELPRKQAGELAAQYTGGVLRGTEGDARPLVKGQPVQLPEGERPFAHPFYWAAFVLVGDPA